MTEKTAFSPEKLHSLVADALQGAGATADVAQTMAASVVRTEQLGISSHGVQYVPIYCAQLEVGKINPAAQARVVSEHPLIRIDADNGFAHPAIELGTPIMLTRATNQGIAMMTIRESYNCGVLGIHVRNMAEQGYYAFGFTNAPASIAPHGGTRPVLGTNPIAFAAPNSDGQPPLVIDQSASVIAKSEVVKHSRTGTPIPEGWALDAEGNPTTDPQAGLKGSMVPSGGYKGFNFAMVTDIMVAVLGGALLSSEASPFAGTEGGPPRTGQCFIAISAEAVTQSVGGGRSPADTLARLCSTVESAGGRVPGVAKAANLLSEIHIAQELVEKVQALAAKNHG